MQYEFIRKPQGRSILRCEECNGEEFHIVTTYRRHPTIEYLVCDRCKYNMVERYHENGSWEPVKH